MDYSKLLGAVGLTLSTEYAEVLILGLGESGLAVAKWFLQCGYAAKIADTRCNPPKAKEFNALLLEKNETYDDMVIVKRVPCFEFYFGSWTSDLLENIKLMVISPGLSMHDLENAKLLELAKSRNILVWSEFDFFYTALAVLRKTDSYFPKIIVVTGTNGKTTVCRLINYLLEKHNIASALAGNIGPALLDRLQHALRQYEINGVVLPAVWVIEASSFQLTYVNYFFSNAAALLNVTQDHLDWHGSFNEYLQAKKKIFSSLSFDLDPLAMVDSKTSKHCTVRVLCRDDHESMTAYSPYCPCVTVGSDLPQRDGDYGVLVDSEVAWLVQKIDSDFVDKKSDGVNAVDDMCFDVITAGQLEKRYVKLMPVHMLNIYGRHNICNVLSAIALVRAIGYSLDNLVNVIQDYRGEPHRMQFVCKIKDICFIDDSKATNVGATLAALKSLSFPTILSAQKMEKTSNRKKCLLIAGGDGKGQDFMPLARPISQICKALFLIGRDAKNIAKIVTGHAIKVKFCSSLEEAVKASIEYADIGDIVLLSPACASLDMFKNYQHRAKVFCNAVKCYEI